MKNKDIELTIRILQEALRSSEESKYSRCLDAMNDLQGYIYNHDNNL